MLTYNSFIIITNVIIKRPVNAGVSNALGLELAYNYKPFSWWILDFGTNLFYYQIIGKIAGSSLDQETFTYRGRLSNNFILKHNFICHFIIFYHMVYLDSLHQKTS